MEIIYVFFELYLSFKKKKTKIVLKINIEIYTPDKFVKTPN